MVGVGFDGQIQGYFWLFPTGLIYIHRCLQKFMEEGVVDFDKYSNNYEQSRKLNLY